MYYNVEIDHYYLTPLWYAVVAEHHLSEALIQPVIQLYTVTSLEGWDYLSERGMNMIGLLCEKFGETAVTPTLEFILAYVEKKERHPILYLFDCLYFINKEKHLPIIFNILKYDQFIWVDAFAVALAHAQIAEPLDRLKEIKLFKEQKLEHTSSRLLELDILELNAAIEELETGKLKYPKFAKPTCQRASDWRVKYQHIFKQKKPIADVFKKKKTGRNDPCICGSGKKYKKCCLGKMKALG